MLTQIGQCLSDHVHRYYGAVSPRTMRPDVSYEDMRSASGNSGNVEENKSLYWNPVIYKVNNQNAKKTYEMVDMWFSSAYYVFNTGQAKAFPNGLKMRTGVEKLSRVVAECVGPSTCERDDDGGCEGYGPSNQEQHGTLPVEACSELEMSIKFPTCWDGINLESKDGKNHVVYSEECDGTVNECFDFNCPTSHPVKMPEILLYVRVLDYKGGAHVFADGSDVFHSDYFSGWDEKELQYVLDNCENDGAAAEPNFFCSDFLTFRGKPKQEGVQVDDLVIYADLQKIQPEPIDTKATISPENVTGIPELPRGACTGQLIDATTTTTSDISGAPASECCAEKKVGDTLYELLTKGDTTGFSCLDSCIYQDKENRGQQVCFQAGDLPVECINK